MSAPDLFQATENRDELKRLQQRREALLKRLQGLPPMSRKRAGLTDELSHVVTEMIAREMRCYPGGWE